MTPNQCELMRKYIKWLFEEQILTNTGPVVSTHAADILFEREDPLLEILKAAGKVNRYCSCFCHSTFTTNQSLK